nr:reverse transcriptase domain-containing protein [Tanacetum cinerariifolium]
MSAMANTTPIMTTVTKTVNKKKMPREANAALKVNILDFYEEHYEDILPVIMDKIRRDKQKEVHARLDFRETYKKSQRVGEGSQNSSAGTLPARYRNPSERPKRRDRLRPNDENMFDRLGHRRQSAFDRLSGTYSPSTTKSGLDRENSRNCSHSRDRSRRQDSSPSRSRSRSRDRLCGIEESYGNTCPSYRIGARHRYHSHDRDRSRSMKRGRESESPLSCVSKSGSSDGGHWKSKALECMRIFGFMHGVNNPELTKRLNQHVPKTMEEMMGTTTAFIQGETTAASKKKGHTSWKPQDQPKHHVSEQRSDFRGKFKPPPPMVTPVEKRSSNKFCDFHNDKGHSTDECVQLKKQIEELVRAGDVEHSTKAWMNFMIIRGIVTIRSTVLIPPEYVVVTTTSKEILKEAELHHKNFKVALHPNFSDQEIAIGGTLSIKGRTKLCSLLKENLDIFAWQPSDMMGAPRSVAEHRLNIREGYPPVRQKKRGQALKHARAIQVEVQKLVKARIIREVYYHDWLSNPVMDCYPLPKIDWKVESLRGYPFKCFLDAYKGYHQIQMAESDEEKMAFHTGHGVYCYTKMPFGLKNAGATYQRLVDKAFDSQVGRNREVYIDDLVIKSHTKTEMLRDIC